MSCILFTKGDYLTLAKSSRLRSLLKESGLDSVIGPDVADWFWKANCEAYRDRYNDHDTPAEDLSLDLFQSPDRYDLDTSLGLLEALNRIAYQVADAKDQASYTTIRELQAEIGISLARRAERVGVF